MTEARIVIILLSGDVLTGQWDQYTDAILAQVKDSIGEILADETGNFRTVTDENTTVFIASRRINFIRLETR